MEEESLAVDITYLDEIKDIDQLIFDHIDLNRTFGRVTKFVVNTTRWSHQTKWREFQMFFEFFNRLKTKITYDQNYDQNYLRFRTVEPLNPSESALITNRFQLLNLFELEILNFLTSQITFFSTKILCEKKVASIKY